EAVEQFLVNLRHAAEELDVVDQKAIHAANPFPERGQGADLLRVGEARRGRFAGHVQHFRFLRMGGDVVPDRMEEMGLPEARAGRDGSGLYSLAGCFATATAAPWANRLLSPTMNDSNVH